MLRRIAVLILFLLLAAATPAYADDGAGMRDERRGDTRLAHHGMMASAECGVYTFKADLTKGRTDSMLIHARHTEGCFTYEYTNYAPAGRGEQQGNAWQASECERAREDVARHFNYYRHIVIDPASVRVSCEPYAGPD